MLAHRLLGASGGLLSRQSSRSATTWAVVGAPHASSSSTSHPAKSQSSSTASSSSSSTATTKGRSKPFRPTGQAVRGRSPLAPRGTSLASIFLGSSPEPSSRRLTSQDSRTGTPPIPTKTQGRRRPRYAASVTRSAASSTESGGVEDDDVHIFQQCQIPSAEGYSFRPIALWPLPLTFHRALTPSHQPIMANLGVQRYIEPPSASSSRPEPLSADTLFSIPPPPSPVPALTKPDVEPSFGSLPSGSSLTDHLRVTAALSHPTLSHHLGSPAAPGPAPASATGNTPGSRFSPANEDPDTYLMRILAEADVRHQVSSEWAFESVLAKLGDKDSCVVPPPGTESESQSGPSSSSSSSLNGTTSMSPAAKALATNEGERERMTEALKGLEGTLDRLEAGEAEIAKIKAKGRAIVESAGIGLGKGVTVQVKVIRMADLDVDGAVDIEDLGVMLDSVKRKRKKKITKHKYKKRRKATRAQRKRLGK